LKLTENSKLTAENTSITALTGPLIVSEKSTFELSDQEFSQISNILLFKRDFNLEAYKDKCVRRRIAIRVRANHCASAKDYCDLLCTDKHEIDHLLKVLTIHVSQFFRNFSTFEKLRTEIIPHLFTIARQNGKKSLRFLSLGCSSGEEPYSLALILAEHFSQEMLEIPVSIDATDVDAGILKTAIRAVYNHERLIEAPVNLIQKYFSEEDTQYRLLPSIQEMVSFFNGDMFNNLIYQNCDLILCRNVMIYFAREQQEKVLANIARSLWKHGFLVLGKSETILGESRAHFQTVCPIERIYRPIDYL